MLYDSFEIKLKQLKRRKLSGQNDNDNGANANGHNISIRTIYFVPINLGMEDQIKCYFE